MESTWLRYLWDSRPNSLIVSGVVTTAVAYGLYRVFRWLQESKKGCAQFDEYFENIENKVSCLRIHVYTVCLIRGLCHCYSGFIVQIIISQSLVVYTTSYLYT